MTSGGQNWLLIQWGDESCDVVHLNSVISPKSKIGEGVVVIVDRGNCSHEAANVLATATERHLLEHMIDSKAELNKENERPQNAGGPDNNDEDKDFSASASSWEPSDENLSTDDEEVKQKKIKTERFGRSYTNKRSNKILKPRHRAEAINVIVNKCRKRTIEGIKKTLKGNTAPNKISVPDSTKKNQNSLPNHQPADLVSIDVREVMNMKQNFYDIFSIVTALKSFLSTNDALEMKTDKTQEQPIVKPELVNNTLYDGNVEENCDISERSEDLNRSDDNVLITNKYDNTRQRTESDSNQNNPAGEWIAIGSGKTLIHIDQYRKVNWKSYTIATRTLLLAVFPRKILATHSLTGKRSPAFQDKPAKMCLDPKIVSDVIIEITDRFKVKENLVRSIITTKCADECKMFKLRQKQKQKRRTLPPKQEDKDNADNGDANQTC